MAFLAVEGISSLPNNVPSRFENMASVETRKTTSSRPTTFICKEHQSALVNASSEASRSFHLRDREAPGKAALDKGHCVRNPER